MSLAVSILVACMAGAVLHAIVQRGVARQRRELDQRIEEATDKVDAQLAMLRAKQRERKWGGTK